MLSQSQSAKWLTAIPLPYTGGDEFWGRDAGLICLGLRELGIDCRFVALGRESDSEDPPLILTSMEKMRQAAWWKKWGAANVLLYSWGAPRHEPIARAIHEAGSKLIVRLDTDGVTSPRVDFWRYWDKTYCAFREEKKFAAALQALAKSVLFRAWPGLYDDKVISHVRHADVLAIESPTAQQRYRRFLADCGHPAMGEKLRVLAHPVAECFQFDASVPKERRIIAVGRWESIFKDAPRIIKVLAEVLRREPEYRATVIGNGQEIIQKLIARWARDVSARFDLRPRVPQHELVSEYQRAQVILVASRSESFHIASAAALCCGCSVVGPPHIPSVAWFTADACGTLASNGSVAALTNALRSDLAAWRHGERHPEKISAKWSKRVTTRSVALRCTQLLGENSSAANEQ